MLEIDVLDPLVAEHPWSFFNLNRDGARYSQRDGPVLQVRGQMGKLRFLADKLHGYQSSEACSIIRETMPVWAFERLRVGPAGGDVERVT